MLFISQEKSKKLSRKFRRTCTICKKKTCLKYMELTTFAKALKSESICGHPADSLQLLLLSWTNFYFISFFHNQIVISA